jgi:hypothetical protein
MNNRIVSQYRIQDFAGRVDAVTNLHVTLSTTTSDFNRGASSIALVPS